MSPTTRIITLIWSSLLIITRRLKNCCLNETLSFATRAIVSHSGTSRHRICFKQQVRFCLTLPAQKVTERSRHSWQQNKLDHFKMGKFSIVFAIETVPNLIVTFTEFFRTKMSFRGFVGIKEERKKT